MHKLQPKQNLTLLLAMLPLLSLTGYAFQARLTTITHASAKPSSSQDGTIQEPTLCDLTAFAINKGNDGGAKVLLRQIIATNATLDFEEGPNHFSPVSLKRLANTMRHRVAALQAEGKVTEANAMQAYLVQLAERVQEWDKTKDGAIAIYIARCAGINTLTPTMQGRTTPRQEKSPLPGLQERFPTVEMGVGRASVIHPNAM